MEKRKHNCYNCKFKENIPGDYHIACKYPGREHDALSMLIGFITEEEFTSAITGAVHFKIRLNPHGVKNGWCNWPFNFDPIWVDECQRYTPVEEEKEE